MKRFAASADSETDENIWEIVEDAYVYAFPLVLMDATETSATNTEEAFTEKAPVNQFIHSAALVALAGLGANTVEVALYPKIEQDADGNTLTGEKSYILHFESYPQVLEGGFWSVTAYGDDDFLIDNPIDRYCIKDRSGLKVNDDGSVDVILSKDAPEDTTNWLPVGDGGFHLYMRIYTPDMDALETWTAPTITEIDSSKAN